MKRLSRTAAMLFAVLMLAATALSQKGAAKVFMSGSVDEVKRAIVELPAKTRLETDLHGRAALMWAAMKNSSPALSLCCSKPAFYRAPRARSRLAHERESLDEAA